MGTPSGRTGNFLLDSVPASDLDRLINGIAPSTMEHDQVVQRPNTPIQDVLFPTSGVASVMTFLNHGNAVKTVEAITVGREGMTNVHAAVGATMSGPDATVMQVDGKGFVVAIGRVTAEMHRQGVFADVVHRYVQAFWAQTAFGSACNAVHHVTQRCAQWLLQTHDRVDGDTFYLTQEYLANMLGDERSTVSVAAGDLQRRGLIEYSRGNVTVRDRPALESAACECYGKIRAEHNRLAPMD
jgi:hypothetical protein